MVTRGWVAFYIIDSYSQPCTSNKVYCQGQYAYACLSWSNIYYSWHAALYGLFVKGYPFRTIPCGKQYLLTVTCITAIILPFGEQWQYLTRCNTFLQLLFVPVTSSHLLQIFLHVGTYKQMVFVRLVDQSFLCISAGTLINSWTYWQVVATWSYISQLQQVQHYS